MRWTPLWIALFCTACGEGKDSAAPSPAGGAAQGPGALQTELSTDGAEPRDGGGPALPTELWPAEALLAWVVPSPPDLVEAVGQITGLFSEEGTRPEAAQWLERLGAEGDLTELDQNRPLAVALVAGEPAPHLAFLLPIHDATRFAAPLAGSDKPLHLQDGYALIGADPAQSFPDWARGLERYPALRTERPLVALRLDMPSLAPRVLPLVDLYLAPPKAAVPPATAGTTQALADLLRELFASVSTLDLQGDWHGGELDLTLRFALLADGSLADWLGSTPPGVADLAHGLSPDAAILVAGGMEPRLLRDHALPWLRALYRSYPEPMRQATENWIDTWQDRIEVVGAAFAGSQELGPEGMRATYLLRPTDPELLVEALITSFRATPLLDPDSISVEREVEQETRLVRMRGRYDTTDLPADLVPQDSTGQVDLSEILQATLGQETIMVVARRAGYVAFDMGSAEGGDLRVREALDRVQAGSAPPAPIAELLARHPNASPLIVASLDLGAILRGSLALAQGALKEEAPSLPEGLAVPVEFYAAGEEGELRLGLRLDLASLAELVHALGK